MEMIIGAISEKWLLLQRSRRRNQQCQSRQVRIGGRELWEKNANAFTDQLLKYWYSWETGEKIELKDAAAVWEKKGNIKCFSLKKEKEMKSTVLKEVDSKWLGMKKL